MRDLRRLVPVLLLLCATLACPRSARNQLPDEFLGRWYATAAGGGITGEGGGAVPTGWIEIRSDTIAEYRDDGTLIGTTPFTAARGATIFSTEPMWLVTREGQAPAVIRVADDGQTMSITDNAYDGIGIDYARVR